MRGRQSRRDPGTHPDAYPDAIARPDADLHYEEHGAGFPILLIAPGGMRSVISAWEKAPWNPVEHLADRYRVIAMDQRNAGASVGVGMGQVNRVDSCQLAVTRAGERARGSVAASDAFFPFADGLQVLLDAGVRAVVQPGGSIRDDEVVAAAAASRGIDQRRREYA